MNSLDIVARRSGGLLLSLLLIFIAGLNFSFIFSVNKIATEAGVPFFAYVFWYTFGAGAVLFVIAAIRRELPRVDFIHLRAYGVAAALGIAFPFALLAFVAPKLPSGVAVLLVILTPAFTYFFSLLARLERIHHTPHIDRKGFTQGDEDRVHLVIREVLRPLRLLHAFLRQVEGVDLDTRHRRNHQGYGGLPLELSAVTDAALGGAPQRDGPRERSAQSVPQVVPQREVMMGHEHEREVDAVSLDLRVDLVDDVTDRVRTF